MQEVAVNNKKIAVAELGEFVKMYPVECRLFLQRRSGFCDRETFTGLFRDMVRSVDNWEDYKHLVAQLYFEINNPGRRSEDWEELLKSKTPEITDKELVRWCDDSQWGPYHILENSPERGCRNIIADIAIEAVCDLMNRFEKKLGEGETNT